MPAGIGATPALDFITSYRRADAAERVRLLREFVARPGDAPIGAAIIVIDQFADFSLAERLLRAHNPTIDAARALNAVVSGMANVARGRWSQAMPSFTSAYAYDEALTRRALAWCAQLPTIEIPEADLRTMRSIWQRSDSIVPAATEPYDERHLAPALRLHALGVMSARLGEREAAHAYAERMTQLVVPEPWRPLTAAIEQSLRVRLLIADSSWDEALRVHEQISLHGPVGMQPLAADRFIRAELLMRAGRTREALRWLDHAFDMMGSTVEPTFIYAAPRALRRAQAYDALGERQQAARWYAHFLQLWDGADATHAALLQEARARSAALLQQPR